MARAVPQTAGLVVGLDAWDEMVALARRDSPGARFAWALGDFHRLPFRTGAFDALLCQQGLQFADDLGALFAEALRVLRPGAPAVFAVWADLAASPAFGHLRREVAKRWGEGVAPSFEMAPPLDRPEGLRHAMEAAGFRDARVERLTKDVLFPSPKGFLLDFIAGSMLLDLVPAKDAEAQEDLLDAMERTLAPWTGPDGLRFPVHAHVASGTSGERGN